MAIEITNFRKYRKNTLYGFLSLKITKIGLEIRDITLHEKNGSRWLSMPARPFKKDDGTESWAAIVRFYDKDRWSQFQEAVLEALDQYNATSGREKAA